MSFSKTVSVFAALASIFAAGATGWKLAQDKQPQDTTELQNKIEQLETQVKQQQLIQTSPPTPTIQQPQIQQVPSSSLPPPLPPITNNNESH